MKYRSSRSMRHAVLQSERFPHASMGLLLGLTLAWVLLWGEFSVGNVAAGFLAALVVTSLAPFPAVAFDGRFRPWGVVLLVTTVMWEMALATAQISWFIVRGHEPRSGVIKVGLHSRSDVYIASVAGLTALIPGTVVVDVSREESILYVHIFDMELAGGIDNARQSILTVEERLLRAFASHDELVDAGYVPGPSRSYGRLEDGQ
ncbi:Na+/H+ antiporter subunit E [Arcanobacterium pinnipediorum]|uniref:Na+/H+ antiporter subunit E n=1 Tax=Arcanobacterium pinnipediorum TaxID=1503041 RepID=A0ABY5AH52_9ACTO|nr:Na+/H+ antiporter subunit E [Arcanobacterium pinnipediorum]USR79539.1 Na+/H+ antiporter subunit E [Arcanobacterium pinnipediorum]